MLSRKEKRALRANLLNLLEKLKSKDISRKEKRQIRQELIDGIALLKGGVKGKAFLDDDLITSLDRIKKALKASPTVNSLEAIEEDVRAVDEVYDSIADEPLVIEVVELFNNLISSNTEMDSLGGNLFTLSAKALKTKERLDYKFIKRRGV
jgi:hypothetical protein